MSDPPSAPTLPAAASTAPATAAAGAIEAVKIYGRGENQVVALDNVTVAFEKSKFSAIMGPSGSGKSTLMHCLAGLDALTSGAVYIGDTYLAKRPTSSARQRSGLSPPSMAPTAKCSRPTARATSAGWRSRPLLSRR